MASVGLPVPSRFSPAATAFSDHLRLPAGTPTWASLLSMSSSFPRWRRLARQKGAYWTTKGLNLW
jgi:hypothetical protein